MRFSILDFHAFISLVMILFTSLFFLLQKGIIMPSATKNFYVKDLLFMIVLHPLTSRVESINIYMICD